MGLWIAARPFHKLTWPDSVRAIGLRYQEVFKFLPTGASQPVALKPMG
jgi:hypothetical protein